MALCMLEADAVLSFAWLDDRTASVRGVCAHDALLDASLDGGELLLSLPRVALAATGGLILETDQPRRWVSSALRALLPATPTAVLAATTDAEAGGMIALWFNPEARHEAAATVARVEKVIRSALTLMLAPDARQMAANQLAVRFDAIMATVRQAILFVDDATGTGLLNHAAASLLGLPPGTVNADVLAERMAFLRSHARNAPGAQPQQHQAGVAPERRIDNWLWLLDAPRRCALRVSSVPVHGADLRGRLWTFDDVTAETDAENDAREAEARFRSALDGMLDAFYIFRAIRDGAGRVIEFAFVDVNAEGAQLAHSRRQDLLGIGICDAFPVVRESGLFDLLVQVMETRKRYDGEYQPQDPRISAKWLRLQIVPSADGVAMTSRDITAQRRADQILRELSLNDELTGLLNRRGFTQIVQHELHVARRQQRTDALLFIDLDDFKVINDVFGHAVGDDALRVVARLLREATRNSDVVGRFGGDEFVIYAADLTHHSEGDVLASRIHATVAQWNAAAARSGAHSIGLSIGVANVRPGETLDEALTRADTAQYAAKRERKRLTAVNSVHAR